jgi:hypothetical protein
MWRVEMASLRFWLKVDGETKLLESVLNGDGRQNAGWASNRVIDRKPVRLLLTAASLHLLGCCLLCYNKQPRLEAQSARYLSSSFSTDSRWCLSIYFQPEPKQTEMPNKIWKALAGLAILVLKKYWFRQKLLFHIHWTIGAQLAESSAGDPSW